MDLSIIKNLCEKRSGGLKRLALEIDMSETNLHRCIRTNKIQASDLENVARVLGVSILTFFDEASGLPVPSYKIEAKGRYSQAAGHDINNNSNLLQEISHLKERLSDKEELIATLRERIADLKGGKV